MGLVYDKATNRMVQETVDSSRWHDQRMAYNTGQLIYFGKNLTHKAATDATTWNIWKYTWDGSDCTRIEGPLVGSWDNRASLAWA
jgi:hypothetical protein